MQKRVGFKLSGLLPAIIAALVVGAVRAPTPSLADTAAPVARTSCTFSLPCAGVSVSLNIVAETLPPEDTGLTYVATVTNLYPLTATYEITCAGLSAQLPCTTNVFQSIPGFGGQVQVTIHFSTKGLGHFQEKVYAVNQSCDGGECQSGTKWYKAADTAYTPLEAVAGDPIGSIVSPAWNEPFSSTDTILVAFSHPSGVDSTTFKLYLNGVDKTASAHRTHNTISMSGVALPDSTNIVAAYGCAVNGRCDSVPAVSFLGKDPPSPPTTTAWLADDSLPPPTDVTTALEVPGALPLPPDSLKGCPVHPGDPTFVFNGSYLDQPAWGTYATGLLAVPLGSSAQGDTVLEIVTSNHDYLPSDTGSVCTKFSYLPDSAYNWNFWTGIPATAQSDSLWAGYPYGDHPVTDPPGGRGFASIMGGASNGSGNGKGGNGGNGKGKGNQPIPFLLAAGAMDPDSVEMWLNGVQVIRNGVPVDTFVHLVQNVPLTADYKFGVNDPLMNRYDVTNPPSSPNGGWNELIASMADSGGHRTKGRTRFIQIKPIPQRPVVVTPLRSFSKLEQSECAAFGAFQCSGVMLTQTIPGFVTRDKDRSLHLVYRSNSQRAPTVLPLELTLSAFQQVPDSFVVFSKATGSTAADTLHYFGVTHPAGAQSSRPGLLRWTTQSMVFGAQINAPDTGTARIRSDSVVVRARYGPSTTQDNVLVQEVTQAYLTDSTTTRVGPGWALAEQSRLVFGQQSQGDTAAIWLDGDGSYEIFLKVNHLWVSPPGETAHLLDSTTTLSQPAAHVLYLSSGASIAFRSDGRQVWTADLLGNRTRFVYPTGTSSRLDSIVDPSKMAYRFKYNTSGNGTNLVSDIVMRDSAGDTARVATLAYNSSGQLRSVTIWRSATQGDSTRFGYQSNRFSGAYIDSIIDPRNPATGTPTIVTTFSYDTLLYTPISMTRPSTLKFGTLTEWYRDPWRRAVPTDSFGRRWGGVAQPQAGLLYPSDLRTSFVDFSNRATDAMVDRFGSPTWVDVIAPPPVYAGGFVWVSQGTDDIRVITRDTVGRVLKIVHDSGSAMVGDSVMYAYDALGRADTIQRNTLLYPAGTRVLDTTAFVFDSVTLGTSGQWCSRLKRMVDPMQGTDTVSYPNGTAVSACLPTKTRDVSGDTTHYTYGTLSVGVTSGVRPISIVDASGVVTSAVYDAKTWNTSRSIVAAANDTSRIYYDFFGRPDSSFDGVKARTVTYHDLSGRVTAARTGVGAGAPTAVTTRDAAGNTIRVRTFAGQAGSGNDTVPLTGVVVDTTTFFFNNLSQLDSTFTPGHRRTSYVRDERGNPLWEYTGNGSYIFRFYNWRGQQLYENTSAMNPGYTFDGQPFASSATTTMYESINLTNGATLSNGQVHAFSYDSKSRPLGIQTVDLGLGISTLLTREYGYSHRDQLIADTLAFSAGITLIRSYQYNRRGQRTLAATNVTGVTVTEPIDTTRYYYDSLTGHLDSIAEVVDSAGTVVPVGRVRWLYDLAQRDTLRGIRVGGGSGSELKTRYTYNTAGRMSLMSTGTTGTWYQLSSPTYDVVGRLLSAAEVGPCAGSTPTCTVSRTDGATYDTLGTGRLLYSTNSDADYTWGYDTWGNRLNEAVVGHVSGSSSGSDTSTYAVDNSLVRTFHVGTGGLINHYYSDQAGNRLMQRDSSNAGGIDDGIRYAMSYTAKNQLFFSAVPSAQSGGGFDVTWNWYDASGMRAITKVDYESAWNGSISPAASTGTWTYYLYDGSDPVLTVAKFGSTWKVTARNLTGGVDQPILGRFVNLGGTVTENLGLVEDKQGTTLAAMLSNGSQESNAIYFGKNAFGAYVVAPTTSGYASTAFNSGSGFSGASTPSQSTGFTYMRNRWYDPQTGRFLTQDPIGLAGGVNLYAYAGNNPISYSDPFGLKECTQENYKDCKLITFTTGAQAGLKVGGSAGSLHAQAGVSGGVVHEYTVTVSGHEQDTRVEGSAGVSVGAGGVGAGPQASGGCSLTSGQCDHSVSGALGGENSKGNGGEAEGSGKGDLSLTATIGHVTLGVTIHFGEATTAAVGAAKSFFHGMGSFLSSGGSDKGTPVQAPTNPFGVPF